MAYLDAGGGGRTRARRRCGGRGGRRRRPDPGAAARRSWRPEAEAGRRTRKRRRRPLGGEVASEAVARRRSREAIARGIPRLRQHRIFGFGRIRTRRAAEAEGGRAAVGASALQRVEAEG